MYSEWIEKVEQNEIFHEISSETIGIWENLDKAFLIEQRRKNYRTLYAYLNTRIDIDIPFGEEVTNCVPMYFPIYAKTNKERNELQRMLGDEAVYCPVIWPYSDLVTELSAEGKYIYDHILCMPIDQRYQEEDMKDIIKVMETLHMK